MPARGGAADKAGTRYEVLWAIQAALRIVNGSARSITCESLDPEAARGVEFSLHLADNNVEYWSVKRQTSADSGWSLATLVRPNEQGRSILGDLVGHVERDVQNRAVFASSLGAARLQELCETCAAEGATLQILEQRLAQSRELKSDFDKYLLPLFGPDKARAHRFLTRLQVTTMDERSLQSQLESTISLLFYRENTEALDAPAVRRLLAEYLLEQLHQPIDQKLLLDHLKSQGIRRKDWKLDTSVCDQVASLCTAYTQPLLDLLIAGTQLPLPGVEKLLTANGLPTAPRTLISAGAGGGKSTALGQIIAGLRTLDVPVLALRMDHISDKILTPQGLGKAHSLPASPVTVLAGLAEGGACVLVIDQLDAVSLSSGRRTNGWSLFEQLLAEADSYPNLHVIVACRAFDLEHDHRMRKLKAPSSSFELVQLGEFSSQTLDTILGDRQVHSQLKPLLALPLHLHLIFSLERSQSHGLATRDELFGAFWLQKQQNSTQRLGRTCNFTGVVDCLADWLSEHQQLSAPAFVLDEFQDDASALASEHLLVLTEGRYRFFHETFFDYAFARRFANQGVALHAFLVGGEQHLFRRAQVRQILSFLRSNDPPHYLKELRLLVSNSAVRFHIKRVVFQLLAANTHPTEGEWTILRELAEAEPDLRDSVRNVIFNHVGWFDTLDTLGFFDQGLSSGDTGREWQVIWLCAQSTILEERSARIAAILIKCRRSDQAWVNYLRHICRFGQVFHSREMFDLFLSLIHDGTLDGSSPPVATEDNWFRSLYQMAEQAPDWTSEAISAWLDRKMETWNHLTLESPSLKKHLASDGIQSEVIAKAALASLSFVEQLLPGVAQLINQHATPREDHLDQDPLFTNRVYGEAEYGDSTPEAIFKALARALEKLARSAPVQLDLLLGPYLAPPHDAVAYLVLRAWTAAPDTYADRLASYLTADPRRLRVGYSFNNNASYRSLEAVRAASPSCSPTAFTALENTILHFSNKSESRHPQSRGLEQLHLLRALDQNRLGQNGRTKLDELQRKFPNAQLDPPRSMRADFVGSPISTTAQAKMTDPQWLSALARYAGIEYRWDRETANSGGERQLAQDLEANTKADPQRFLALSASMPSQLPSAYFDAILKGVAASAPPVETEVGAVSLSAVYELIERTHALPDQPCGRWIVHLVKEWNRVKWPPTVIETVAWYATKDPDPSEELWRKRTSTGEFYYSGDPDFSGLNSTRGAAAHAIASLLLANHESNDVLVSAVDSLAHDPSIAVRSQAIYALLALFNTQPDQATCWFVECVSIDPVLLGTSYVEHLVWYAGNRDYAAVQPVLQAMLTSEDQETLKTGASLCCLLALHNESAKFDAAQVRSGNPAMRAAAATLYASKVADKELGASCRELLLPFFSDTEDTVRAQAAQAFHQVAELDLGAQTKLLTSFLNAQPTATALEPVIRALEDSPLQLPDLVCSLIESAVEAFKPGANDIRSHGALVAGDLSKIVVRLYAQSADERIKTRCLNAIDVMERSGFFGLSDELERLDR